MRLERDEALTKVEEMESEVTALTEGVSATDQNQINALLKAENIKI